MQKLQKEYQIERQKDSELLRRMFNHAETHLSCFARGTKDYENKISNLHIVIAIIWYDEKMPYCELEPLGVVWWCRRKGIAEALIHEAANRIMNMEPQCRGMLGGDQQFYWDLGFKVEAIHEIWDWNRKF